MKTNKQKIKLLSVVFFVITTPPAFALFIALSIL